MPHEQHERLCGIYAAAGERVGGGGLAVLLKIDAVVDHGYLRGGDVEEAQHVVAGFLGNGDDGVGVFDASALHPAAEMVGVAELLDLPGAQRLERVDGEDEGRAPELLGEKAAHIGVPGVAMHHVGVERVLRHRETAVEGVERAAEARVGVLLCFRPGGVALHAQVIALHILVAEAAHLNLDEAGELAAEILHMHAGAAVDVGGILVGEERHLAKIGHRGHLLLLVIGRSKGIVP